MVVLLGYTLLASCQQINHLPLGTPPYRSSSVAGGSTLYMKDQYNIVLECTTLLVTLYTSSNLPIRTISGSLGLWGVRYESSEPCTAGG